MRNKGFTLIEIIAVLIIVGVLAAITVPNILVSIGQAKAQTAQNNLLTIYAAQQKYFEDNASYCTTNTGAVANCGTTLTSLNANLNLSLTDKYYSYQCISAPPTYSCTANPTMNIVNSTLATLTLNPSYAATPQTTPYLITCGPPGGNSGFCPSVQT